MKRIQQALAAGVLVGGLVTMFAAPAEAHAEVRATSPGSGSSVHGTLTEVSVTFDEAVSLVPHALRMTTDLGIPVQLEVARLTDSGKLLSAQVQDHLAAGHYAVAWRVQADDGHIESSTFSFSVVGAAVPASPGVQAPAGPLPSGPGEPLWPILVAAAIAAAGGVGAGFAVRRGLRIAAATRAPYPDGHEPSHGDHQTLHLPT
jgi:methionine-rich copper-binding protein CopC